MKLLIPGPVNVQQKYMDAMSSALIGHRSKEFEELHKSTVMLLKDILNTNNDIFLMTSSATGAMEAAIRNVVNKNVLCIANGDFGRRWHEIAIANGKYSKLLDFGDARPYDMDKIKSELESLKIDSLDSNSSGSNSSERIARYDAITVVINETTTGMENDISELKKILERYPDTLLLADGVTAAFGTNIDINGIDILLFGTQKALALPPGMAISIISQKALDRAKNVVSRGYYFDYILMKKNADKNFTVTTPNISLMYALKKRLEDIKAIGIKEYIDMHRELSLLVRREMEKAGFDPLIDEIHASNTVTVVKNNGINIKRLQESMRQEGYDLANGYGELKDITFRIGHMGLDRQTTIEALEAIKAKVKEQTLIEK